MAPARSAGHAIRWSAVLCIALLAACSGDDGPDDPPGSKVRLEYCVREAPIWLAIQDGDAAWHRVEPIAEGLYEPRFTADRGGVAFVSFDGNTLAVQYGTLAELQVSCATGSKLVHGSVAGLESPASASLWLGDARANATVQQPGTFSIGGIPEGPQDLFGAYYGPTSGYPERVLIRRGVDVASGSELATIDFASAEAFAPALANVSVTGLDDATHARILGVSWHGRSLSYGELQPDGASNDLIAGPVQFPAVPLGNLGPGEMSSLFIDAPGPTQHRYVTTWFRAPTDRVIALGPALSTPVVTWPAGTSAPRPRLQLPSQPSYSQMVRVVYSQNSFSAVVVAMTAGYLGGTPPTWDIEVPDLTSVDGWNPAWGLAATPAPDWTVIAQGGSRPPFSNTFRDGDFTVEVITGGTSDAGETLRERARPPFIRQGYRGHLIGSNQ